MTCPNVIIINYIVSAAISRDSAQGPVRIVLTKAKTHPMTTTAASRQNGLQIHTRLHRPKWPRFVLLSVLGYEGLGCLAGGALLILAPDGRLMDMPVGIMHGAFADFLIPGIILFALGILTIAAFFSVLRRSRLDWLFGALSMGGLAIWFWVEIAILRSVHWLHAMWGLPVVAGALATLSLFRPRALQNGALACGIIASLLYAAINVIVPAQWPAYSTVAQTISELSAIGAPTRTLWIVLSTPYTILSVAFALGVRHSAGKNRRLRIAGTLLLVYGGLGIFWPFAPMHLRDTLAAGGSTFADTMHLALGAATELIYLAALAFAAAAMGKGFRVYSIITCALLLFFGVLTFLEAPNISRGLPTPHIGVWERINIGLFLLWIIVLSVRLIKDADRLSERQ
jgi:hypothetical protein